MADPVRSLMRLQNSASTARVLNLYRVSQRFSTEPEHAARPLFTNPLLNRCIVVKHRLRGSEFQLFDGPVATATKIILPIDPSDLRSGGRSIFIGETSYDEVMTQVFGPTMATGSRDRAALEMLDVLPSLDPFLLREQLKRNGIEAAPCYFDISEADFQSMFSFAQEQIQALVSMSFGDAGNFGAHTAKLVRKILAGDKDNDLEPLRLTLRLDPEQYEEGIFCWKGFLYYSWVLKNIYPQAVAIAPKIMEVRPRGPSDNDTKAYISGARSRLASAITTACAKVKQTITVYDDAYAALTSRGDPITFRDFLLAAPAMFNELGERLGAIQHIVTFWNFRFGDGRSVISPEELMEIFLDFEDGLSFQRA